MKKKILNLAVTILLISILFSTTGCGNNGITVENQIDVHEEIENKSDSTEKSEEEAKYNSEQISEENKTLQVGKYTLKYGEYTSDISGDDLYGTITLNYGGTFHIKSNFETSSIFEKVVVDEDGKYEVKLNQSDGYGGTTNYVEFTTNSGNKFSFEVINNDSLTDQYHGYFYGTTKKTYLNLASNSNTTNTGISSNKKQIENITFANSSNIVVSEGEYNGKNETATTGTLTITNSKTGSFDFNLYGEYMSKSAGYPYIGELKGTAKATTDGRFAYVERKSNGDDNDYNMIFSINGNSITIKTEDADGNNPYCGFNVRFDGTYNK